MEQLVARRVHIPESAGSSPVLAHQSKRIARTPGGWWRPEPWREHAARWANATRNGVDGTKTQGDDVVTASGKVKQQVALSEWPPAMKRWVQGTQLIRAYDKQSGTVLRTIRLGSRSVQADVGQTAFPDAGTNRTCATLSRLTGGIMQRSPGRKKCLTISQPSLLLRSSSPTRIAPQE